MEETAYVIKLGGSLLDLVPELIPVLADHNIVCLIVPGGGAFADVVRQLDPNADAAHWMAISAMDQYGHYIASHGLPTIDRIVRVNESSVFLPYCAMRREDPFPHSWDITSDTIAAWVAWRLDLPLILLKSVDGVISEGAMLAEVSSPVVTDTVDPAFIPFILRNQMCALVINGRSPEALRRALSGEGKEGTIITGRTEEL
ncbi:hypothetical protein RJ53_08285 [Methanocalculus chunghsingensis]|uniref:Uridylate kinase n=2 Tax=Methanocalculus chunghsingensis TaxID=156457 RepID=A0A8J7W8L5_9EURY|nr:uridylate kinase [Methanocalculus chunghsingensis]MBR1369488.1 hypothetical protein [Methanocalculus chunghsingensis]